VNQDETAHRGEWAGGWFTVERADVRILVEMSGEPEPEAFDAVYQAAAALDQKRETTAMLMDLTRLNGAEFDISDIHRMIVSIRTWFPRPPGYRIAVVAVGPFMESVGQLFLTSRDVLSSVPESSRSPTELFRTMEDAIGWLNESPTV